MKTKVIEKWFMFLASNGIVGDKAEKIFNFFEAEYKVLLRKNTKNITKMVENKHYKQHKS